MEIREQLKKEKHLFFYQMIESTFNLHSILQFIGVAPITQYTHMRNKNSNTHLMW